MNPTFRQPLKHVTFTVVQGCSQVFQCLDGAEMVPEVVVDGGDVDVDAALEAPGLGEGESAEERVEWARQLALLCFALPSRRLPNEDSLFCT